MHLRSKLRIEFVTVVSKKVITKNISSNGYFVLTDCKIYFKIDRVQAINNINKVCYAVSQKSDNRCRLCCVNKKCKLSTQNVYFPYMTVRFF